MFPKMAQLRLSQGLLTARSIDAQTALGSNPQSVESTQSRGGDDPVLEKVNAPSGKSQSARGSFTGKKLHDCFYEVAVLQFLLVGSSTNASSRAC
ncbi:MAG: hypothetical protein K2X93_10575 [Candidatus Obscuribacterales bacterium]|nr:hypothetical protein [Candidatus Obscuribacterales bacterium]